MFESLSSLVLSMGAANPLPPFANYFIAAALMLVLPHGLRWLPWLCTPVITAISIASMEHGVHVSLDVVGITLEVVEVDKLNLLFAYLFCLASFIAGIYSLHLRDRLQHVVSMLYSGAAVGAVFAGDLLTLFVFWECLAATSVFLIWSRRSAFSYTAGLRYLIFQVGSGMLVLAAALVHYHETGSIDFTVMSLDDTEGVLLFLAFGIKAAFPMLHTWVTDAYPEATVTGTVFMSSFTTKVAIYALARSYAGTEILIYIGMIMASLPIFYAVIENDLRRVLAYSMINQLGFMVVGIGIGTAMALNGAMAHVFAHVLYKGLLFMSMGAVLYMTGRVNGSDLGGLYKSMPFTTVFCIIGAASISAFPLFSGFVSKSMIMVAAVDEGYTLVWLVLLFASAGVFHHAGIKVPYFAFFAHDSGIRTKEAPVNMLIAMAIAAALCIGIGCYPALLYSLLPLETDYSPYDYTHVVAQLQLLFFSAAAFVWLNLIRVYPPEIRGVNLDVDWLWRRLVPAGIRVVGTPFRQTFTGLRDAGRDFVIGLYDSGRSRLSPQYEHCLFSDVGIIITVILLGVALLFSY